MMSDVAESDRESVVDAINEFAASFDADDDEGVAMGLYNVDDGDAGGGERANKKKRKGRMQLTNVQLLHHFETFLGSGLVCRCLSNCLRILEDEVVKTAVARYLVWFERRSKIDQDNIIMQWMIYGHTPGGRHSATTSQHSRREFGYHVPFTSGIKGGIEGHKVWDSDEYY